MRTHFVFGCLLLCSACQKEELSGDLIGDYKVSASLVANTCGANAVPVQNQFTFNLQLRLERPSLYWIQSSFPMVIGTIDEDNAYKLRLISDTTFIPAEPEQQIPGCVLRQTDEVTGTLPLDDTVADAGIDAAGPGPEQWQANETIDFAPLGASDCAALLIANGGNFEQLPCRLQYDLLGSVRND